MKDEHSIPEISTFTPGKSISEATRRATCVGLQITVDHTSHNLEGHIFHEPLLLVHARVHTHMPTHA